MKLSLKQKALVQTIGLFALALVCGLAVNFIMTYVSTEVVLRALGIGLFAWIAYIFYSITLSRLEHQETWKKLNETFDKK